MGDRNDREDGGQSPLMLMSTQEDVQTPAVFNSALSRATGDRLSSLIEEIAAFSTTQRRTFLDITSEGLSVGSSEVFLTKLYELRRTRKLDLRFRLMVPSSLSKSTVLLLKRAGVIEAVLLPQALSEAQNGDPLGMNLSQLARVKWLHEHDIAVRWRLVSDVGENAEAHDSETVEICRALTHLPPPDSIWTGPWYTWGLQTAKPTASIFQPDGSQPPPLEPRVTLKDAVLAWRTQYSPWTITHSRGPGFIRIFDRRRGYTNAHFITLTSEQWHLLDFLELPRTVEATTTAFSNIPLPTLLSFLERLLDRKLVVMPGRRLFQTFLVRRRQEEKWAYEVN